MKFSVIIPAHNEERYLPACLDAVGKAAQFYPFEVEVVVVLNRCTDGTKKVAVDRGAGIVREDRRNLASIRNTGAKFATGEILVSIDADSVMSENMLQEIDLALQTGRYIGGGVPLRPERTSPGICSTLFLLRAALFFSGLAGGVYWCRLCDFRSIGGFNEELPFGEDLDFAKRLREAGRKSNRKFATLRKTHVVTSCRKFDKFGDWYFFKLALWHRKEVLDGLQGKSTTFQDRYFYDFNAGRQSAPEDE